MSQSTVNLLILWDSNCLLFFWSALHKLRSDKVYDWSHLQRWGWSWLKHCQVGIWSTVPPISQANLHTAVAKLKELPRYCYIVKSHSHLQLFSATTKCISVLENCPQSRITVRMTRLWLDWPWPSIPGKPWSWLIHMQEVKVKCQSVWKIEWKQWTDS